MKIWNVTKRIDDEVLLEAASALRAGELVAFPTETVYGLGANAFSEDAVKSVFTTKGRPADNPLIVHIARAEDVAKVIPHDITLCTPIKQAMAAFWPGPLTILVPASDAIAPSVRPGLDTVGVRCPNHPVAQRLLELAGVPVAAPSANVSGRPSPTRARDVVDDLDGKIAGVVDGGPCEVGLESTVVLITDACATIYRPGAITQSDLEVALGIPVSLDPFLTAETEQPKSPGMKYRHYAPDASVHVWWGDELEVTQAIEQFVRHHADESVAVISPTAFDVPITWHPHTEEDYTIALSRELYGLLREFDRRHASHILVHGVPPQGPGLALMNRLQKAAEGRVYQV